MLKKIIKLGILGLIILIAIVLLVNFYVVASVRNQIINDVNEKENFDCVLVLGAGIRGNRPSPMLQDRLDEAISLYNEGIVSKIIVSGDHGTDGHDEVNIMKDYITEKEIPSEDVFMDHAGFSTYDSVYRAKEIFKANKIIIVTQKYHLYRALYIAGKLDIDAIGIASDPRKYSGQFIRDIREILARDKDFVKCIFKPKPTYLGDAYPVSGNGDSTNDKERN